MRVRGLQLVSKLTGGYLLFSLSWYNYSRSRSLRWPTCVQIWHRPSEDTVMADYSEFISVWDEWHIMYFNWVPTTYPSNIFDYPETFLCGDFTSILIHLWDFLVETTDWMACIEGVNSTLSIFSNVSNP